MWPFNSRNREKRFDRTVKRLITGLIIGGAIGSVVGKHLIDTHEKKLNEEEDEKNTGE